MFNDIRTLTSYLCFESWDALMAFMLQSFEFLSLPLQDQKRGRVKSPLRIAAHVNGFIGKVNLLQGVGIMAVNS